jgi:hypothetical protein
VIIDDVINGCDVLLQEKQNIPNRKKKFHKLKDNCHDETMLTLLLAKAFHSDKLNSYANLTALFTKVISYRMDIHGIPAPLLTNQHSVYVEYQTPFIRSYNEYVQTHWQKCKISKHLYSDRVQKVEKRLESGKKCYIEGSTHFDMVIKAPNQDSIYFEAKYMSDISYMTEYMPCRDQISRCLDAAICDVTNNYTDMDGIKHLWFFLITPDMFRIEEFGGSQKPSVYDDPSRSRMYTYKMRDFMQLRYLEYSLPNLLEFDVLDHLSKRIFWITWEEAAEFVVSNILIGEEAKLTESFFKERNLYPS